MYYGSSKSLSFTKFSQIKTNFTFYFKIPVTS